MLLYQILASITHGKNIKKVSNNKFKILIPTWDETFEIPDG